MGYRFKSDQNKVVAILESGTYAVTSGNAYWVGQVTGNSVTDNEGLMLDRYTGTADRSFGNLIPGPIDVTGTLSYNLQDCRLLFYGIGSVFSVQAAKTGTHTATEVGTNVRLNPFVSGTGVQNSPISFTIEDSKFQPTANRNAIRTLNGCVVNGFTLTATQSEKVKAEVDYVSQTCVYTSGTATATINNAISGVTPYLWNNCTLTIAGSNIPTTKEVSIELANNLDAPHYINGSRVIGMPIVGPRDITLNVSLDWEGDTAGMLYNLYRSNSVFNAVFDMNADVAAVGSKHAIFTFSDCKINSVELPTESEGVVEASLEIRPKNISAIEYGICSSYTVW